ncbi:MAG: hypothetical protein D9C04_00055 [Nitrosopumilus sp. B06]|nr:MAG: hypothetical protein EB828_05570 [Nitrosopumilus sp. D6]RNJ80756.1 MAG: hypothetical protein D9C04_00055 [Nitrosopumilus sp. B06]
MSAAQNHNKHLDMLQNYKDYLVRCVLDLESMDRQSEFAKKWNEQAICERKKEIILVDKILKNLVRF